MYIWKGSMMSACDHGRMDIGVDPLSIDKEKAMPTTKKAPAKKPAAKKPAAKAPAKKSK